MEFDMRRALTFLREDCDARRKITIGGIVSMIPVANLVLLGYGVEIYRNIAAGKSDQDLQPEWENAGEFMLKAIIAACLSVGYFMVGTLICVGIGLIFGASAFGEIATGSEVHVSIFLRIFIAIVSYACSVLFWSGYSLYAESLEFSRGFRMAEVAFRAVALGKSFYVAVGAWLVATSLTMWITGFIPYLGTPLGCLISSFFAMSMVYALGQVSLKRIRPVLSDVVNTGRMEYTEKVRAEEAKFEDEFGHLKEGGRKASHYADHRVERTLTWSTDSDTAELE